MWGNSLFRRLLYGYPQRPLVYLCQFDGVTGIVRAQDFDDEVRRMHKTFNKARWPQEPVRPIVFPVFLFSNKPFADGKDYDFRMDDMANLEEELRVRGWAVERREFYLPPLSNRGVIPIGYFGTTERVGTHGCRHRKYTYEEMRWHIER